MLEWLPNDGNQKTTQDSTFIKENMSEINNIDELPEYIFSKKLKRIDQYQQKQPILLPKYKNRGFKTGPPMEKVIWILTL